VLLAAEALASDNQLFAGLEILQSVLEERPTDPDLLAGQGWLLARSATEESLAAAELGLSYLDRALAADPSHPEALVYRAFVHNFLGNVNEAAVDLAIFDGLPVRPADLRVLLNDFGLRQQVGG
jgi:Flp pilus assembly protein TadD